MFRQAAAAGRHVLISTHILHEVDMVADRVVLLKGGYVVADGAIGDVREEVRAQPAQVLVRCGRPSLLAARLFEGDHVVDARVQEDGQGLLVRTRDADHLHLLLNSIVSDHGFDVEGIAPADGDVHAVYRYLIEEDGSP
jgi:ABC-2 type transport system ATP-binding protein